MLASRAAERFNRMEDPSLNKLVKQLISFRGKSVESVPKGWFNNQKLRTKTGYSDGHIRKLLQKAVKAGEIEVKRFRVKLETGRVQKISYYRSK